MRSRRLTAALTTTFLLITSGAAGAEDLHSADAASAQADADLALVALPTGAVLLAGSPNTALDQPAETTSVDSLVDHNRWWSVPGTVAATLAFLGTYPPAGFTHNLTASGGSSPVTTWGFTRANSWDETLLVSVLQDGDHVDVRADAQVIWTPAKTPAEIVPPTLTSATFDYKGPMAGSYQGDYTTPKPAHAHRVLTGKALRRVAADLNALQTQPLGEVSSCPSDDGEYGKVRAVYGGQHVAFTVAFQGCGGVSVTADGTHQPYLDGGGNLIVDLYATIGVRFTPIPVTPPQGPLPRTAPPHLALQHNKVQAWRVGDRAPGLAAWPNGARGIPAAAHPTRPPYTGSGIAVDRGGFYEVQGTVAELTNYFQAHAAKGYVVARPGKVVHGVTRLVLEPTTHPRLVPSLLWISMLQKGHTVVFRVDGQAAYQR